MLKPVLIDGRGDEKGLAEAVGEDGKSSSLPVFHEVANAKDKSVSLDVAVNVVAVRRIL